MTEKESELTSAIILALDLMVQRENGKYIIDISPEVWQTAFQYMADKMDTEEKAKIKSILDNERRG